jgi:hypothetical protein
MRLFFPNGADEDEDDFEPPSQMGEEVNYPERFVNKPRVKGGLTTNNRKRLMSISEMSQSLTSQKDEHEIPESSPVVNKEEENFGQKITSGEKDVLKRQVSKQ